MQSMRHSRRILKWLRSPVGVRLASISNQSHNVDVLERDCRLLSYQAWEHYRINTQTVAIYQWKMRTLAALAQIQKRVLPDDYLAPSGSTMSGLATNDSDLDVNLLPNDPRAPDVTWSMTQHKDDAFVKLQRLRNGMTHCIGRRGTLGKDYRISTAKLIGARVPILQIKGSRLVDDVEVGEMVYSRKKNKMIPLKRSFDISVNRPESVKDSFLLNHYARWDKRFQVLCSVLLEWAEIHDVKNSLEGRFGSFTLKLLIIHFLQCGVDPPVLPCLHKLYPSKFDDSESSELSKFQNFEGLPNVRKKKRRMAQNTLSVGDLLLAFFDYYNSFEFNAYDVSVREGRCIPLDTRERRPEFYGRPFIVSSPFDPDVNTSRVRHRANTDVILRAISNQWKALRVPKPTLDLLIPPPVSKTISP